ncbi:MAG TPA: terminase large subunit [Candidatus Acidoferrum sp.]|jgi:hypothetical protein
MPSLPLNIIEFVQNVDLLDDQTLSATQICCLKSVYGLPLSEPELEIYQRGTGRATYDQREQREATFIAGRRGGKTGKIAAPIVCYEACRDHGIPPGEEGVVMLLAPTIDQARIAFKYIRQYFEKSELLRERVVGRTKNEITLDNHIVIGCYACTYDRVRGRTAVAVVCDEIAFWADDVNAANPAEEVLAALRPSMATVRNAKLIKISTPYAKSGLIYNEHERRSELNFPVWRSTTFELNTTLTPEMFEAERRDNEEEFRREYNAEFVDAINPWIVPEILNPCVARDRRELPFQSDLPYYAALDAATRGNDFALVILHKNGDGTIVMDLRKVWEGTRTAPLPFEGVLGQVAGILQCYGINTVTGDQFYSDAVSQHLLKLGITYNLLPFGPTTRGNIFSGLKHLLVQQRIELLDDPDLLRELRSLREERTPRGVIDVRPTSGKDDSAVALALAANEAVSHKVATPFLMGSFNPLRLNPENCIMNGVCINFPTCQDDGYCLGYVKQILVPISHEAMVRPPVGS